MNKTYMNISDHNHQWFFIDAQDKTLGRISTQIASNLKNKYNKYYAPHKIYKSYVIVINAEKIKVSGQKKYQKIYRKHSGRPGGLKKETFIALQKRLPERIIEKAVKGMLPKNALGRQLFTALKVYSGPNHPHKAQRPIPLPIK